MKTLKKLLLSILAIVIILAIVAFFLPQHVRVERTATIEAPDNVVFNQVNDLHSWEKWASWLQIDPDMTLEYINSGIGENSGYKWTSENRHVGNGELLISSSVPYDSIETFIDFHDQGIATMAFQFEENGDVTNVSWIFETDLGYNPIARWMGLTFDWMIGNDFEKGLENLNIVCKTIVQENQPVVEVFNMPETPIVSLREEVKWEEIEMKMAYMYGELTKFIQSKQLMMADVPISIYHKIDNGLIDLEAAIPVEKLPEETEGKIEARTLKAGKYVHANHVGPYDQLSETHEFIQKWMDKHHLFLKGSPIEKYYTDPQSQPDSSKWITSIYYPIE